jgi:hypothetical protein
MVMTNTFCHDEHNSNQNCSVLIDFHVGFAPEKVNDKKPNKNHSDVFDHQSI